MKIIYFHPSNAGQNIYYSTFKKKHFLTFRKKRKISWLNSRKFEAELASDHIRVDVLKEVIQEVDEAEHKGSRYFIDSM